jgi:peroxiredoxin Q/BCP
MSQFESVGAQVIGISSQGVESHDEFSGKHGFSFPLLADVDKLVSKQYGILGPLGFPRRSVFVIDGSGVVRYVHRALAGLSFRSVDELVAAVEKAKLG